MGIERGRAGAGCQVYNAIMTGLDHPHAPQLGNAQQPVLNTR
ncbi:hypothetical protein OG563_44570 [Nocardia vinacea]|uniref:Uncharacterized protein n=1 Tax=Nocardia vinacea TaxID=96468 RepID=A0ABZ1YW15_9NOCA|nr:hypothetical protein [Nocardia vinacea]